MKGKTKFLSLVLAAVTVFLGTLPLVSRADETLGEKVDEVKDDAVKNTKKGARKVKRAGRNAVGKGSTAKDIEDKAKDAGDEVKDKVDDVKKKVD